jgi:hypothetical protein
VVLRGVKRPTRAAGRGRPSADREWQKAESRHR